MAQEQQTKSYNPAELVQLSAADFAAAVAQKTPVPGGGGVAAYVATLAAALGEMVIHFTVGKKTYAAYEDALLEHFNALQDLYTRALAGVEADGTAFEALSRAYKLPKDDPHKEEELAEASAMAIKPNEQLLYLSSDLMDILEELAQMGSKLLMSDVAVAAALTRAVAHAAAVNVYINAGSLREEERAGTVILAEYMSTTVSERADELTQHIEDSLSNKALER